MTDNVDKASKTKLDTLEALPISGLTRRIRIRSHHGEPNPDVFGVLVTPKMPTLAKTEADITPINRPPDRALRTTKELNSMPLSAICPVRHGEPGDRLETCAVAVSSASSQRTGGS
jgi:hypothetical protein